MDFGEDRKLFEQERCCAREGSHEKLSTGWDGPTMAVKGRVKKEQRPRNSTTGARGSVII